MLGKNWVVLGGSARILSCSGPADEAFPAPIKCEVLNRSVFLERAKNADMAPSPKTCRQLLEHTETWAWA